MSKVNHAKYAFYYLLSLVALIFTALPTGMIIFQVINKNMPDMFGHYGTDFSQDVLKFAIAAIIIATPIFYIVSRLIYQGLAKKYLEKDAGIRRWLTYFILLVSAVIIIGFLIATVLNFLNGELTTQFILKALTVIGISGAVFSFYLYDIRRREIKAKDRVFAAYNYGSLALVVIAFIISMFIVESPAQTRARRIDDQVINNFYAIENNVINYFNKYQKLPSGLEAIKSEVGFSEEIYKDPVTSEDYKYEIIATSSFKLCANFRTSNVDKTVQEFRYIDDSKRHDTGFQCLNFKLLNNPYYKGDLVPTDAPAIPAETIK
jgi:type II secretory pathway pseudopilin PulG